MHPNSHHLLHLLVLGGLGFGTEQGGLSLIPNELWSSLLVARKQSSLYKPTCLAMHDGNCITQHGWLDNTTHVLQVIVSYRSLKMKNCEGEHVMAFQKHSIETPLSQ